MNSNATLIAHCGTRKISREELREIPAPEGTRTHQPLAHFDVVSTLIESMSFRNLNVVRDEYAVSPDGMRMFGVMDLSSEFDGCRFSVGLRNSNDKSMRLALTAGLRIMVCDNMAFSGDFNPLFHKHTRNLELQDAIALAVERIHRNFLPLQAKVSEMKKINLSDEMSKVIIYNAFVGKRLKGAPRHLLPVVHDHYFKPEYEEFEARTLWSLSNAFTSSFKKLAPVKQFEVTARLGSFLTDVQEDFTQGQVLQFELQKNNRLVETNQSGERQNDSGENDFDLDDIAEDLESEEEFDEYYDSEEETEAMDKAKDDEMIQEFKRRVAA
jgi:hypothetical protein